MYTLLRASITGAKEYECEPERKGHQFKEDGQKSSPSS
jgi:hypothetical protein